MLEFDKVDNELRTLRFNKADNEQIMFLEDRIAGAYVNKGEYVKFE